MDQYPEDIKKVVPQNFFIYVMCLISLNYFLGTVYDQSEDSNMFLGSHRGSLLFLKRFEPVAYIHCKLYEIVPPVNTPLEISMSCQEMGRQNLRKPARGNCFFIFMATTYEQQKMGNYKC